MDSKKLGILLKEKENLTLEFKEKYSPKIDEDLIAFSNTKGGIILLGVSDKGQVVGQELTNDLKAKINTLARNCKPSIQVSISQTDKLVAIEVPEGEEKPYSCSAGYFRRLDGNSQKMSQEEIRSMFQDNDKTPFESKISKECSLDDISSEKIRRYLKEANITSTSQNTKDVLQSANALVDKDKIRNAGVLLFAKDVRKFIPQAKIDLIRFAGVTRVNIFDRLQVQDDLLTQFDQAIFFLKKHLNTRSEIKGVNRTDKVEIPLEALREAVVNAIIHRDYSITGTNISVEIYDDRVVVVNPGALTKGINENNFGKVSIRRNELIADLFYRMDKIERAGTGIERMKKALEEDQLNEPEFDFGSFFTISFKRPSYKELLEKTDTQTQEKVAVKVPEKVTAKVTETTEKLPQNYLKTTPILPQNYPNTAQKILEEIFKNPRITRRELAKATGLSINGVKYSLKTLKNDRLLKRVGSNRRGYWEIIKN